MPWRDDEAIRLVNEAAEKHFGGYAQLLKRVEMTENSLRENAKVVIAERGISATLLLGSLPVTVSGEGHRQSILVKPRNSALRLTIRLSEYRERTRDGNLCHVPSVQENNLERSDHR